MWSDEEEEEEEQMEVMTTVDGQQVEVGAAPSKRVPSWQYVESDGGWSRGVVTVVAVLHRRDDDEGAKVLTRPWSVDWTDGDSGPFCWL